MEIIKVQELINKHILYTSMLNELLKSLLNSSEVKYHIIENRTKTVESLTEKITRKEIINVEKEITDISGIRIILYYQDDVDKIIELIKSNFKIDEKNSVNKADLYDSNEFGYLSTHYIISLDRKRNKLPEWKSFANLKAEIQIRTVLQHSWASISHELTYKKDYEIPKELQRRLFRLAGLFELADEQFLKIRDEHDLLKQSIEVISKSNEIDAERINLLTLRFSFENENKVYQEISSNAIAAGFLDGGQDIDDNDLSEIIRASEILGLKRIHEIEERLQKSIQISSVFFKELLLKSDSRWLGNKSFYNLLAFISLFEKEQLEFFFEQSNWNKQIIELVTDTVLKIKKM